jgi:hypothetical protein
MIKKTNLIRDVDIFWHLKVINQNWWHIYPSWNRTRKYLCQCECWNKKTITWKLLRSWNTTTCWCKNFAKKREKKIFHYCLDCWTEVTKKNSRCQKCFQKWELNPNWKWWITPINNEIRNSNKYKDWRIKCFERDKYTCQVTWIQWWNLVVHHKQSMSIILSKYWKESEKLFDINNWITLCEPIHKWFHNTYWQITTEEDFSEFLNSIQQGIEIKYDIRASSTWNFYIEFECNWKPSGLFRPEKVELAFWAHTDWLNLFLLNGEWFKKWVWELIEKCRINKTNTHKKFRVVENWGDWWRTKGLLVPVDELAKQADYIYKLN